MYSDSETYGVDKLWDNKLGRTPEEVANGTCFHSNGANDHRVELDLDGEYDVSAISILNRADFNR